MSGVNAAFKALSDPTRREVLRLLAQGERTAGELAERFDMTKPSMSHHFAVLKEADLVRARREGQQIYYCLNTTVLQDVLTRINDLFDVGGGLATMTRINGYWAGAFALVAAALAASVLLYPAMPDRIPTHWNIRGEVDGHGSKPVGLFMLPGIMAGMLLFFRALPALSPKNFEVDDFKSTYLYVMLAVTGLFAFIHAVALASAWQDVNAGPKLDMVRVLIGGMCLFFGLIGNVLGKVRRNFYIGVRTPWTIASDRVWNDTHRVAAWLMVGGSVVGFLIVATGLPVAAAIVALLASTLVPVVYSFVHYRRLQRRGEV